MTNLPADRSHPNTVFFSEHLTAYKSWSNIHKAFTEKHIPHALLPFTNDIWARDYMPVRLDSGHFLHYVYHPDYLQKCKRYITDSSRCNRWLNLPTVSTDIVLDGGNMIRCNDKMIMTDKVFRENPQYTSGRLTDQLERLFNLECVYIPWDTAEPFGHTDGMVRHLGKNKILLNNYDDFDKPFRKKLIKALSPHFEMAELHYPVQRLSRFSWAYINFLQINDVLFVPRLQQKEDESACEQLSGFCRAGVVQVEVKDLVKEGGALHCVSWSLSDNRPVSDTLNLYAKLEK